MAFRNHRHSPAWYSGTREHFLASAHQEIANQLAGRAADEGLQIEPEQAQEWRASVEILQSSLDERIPILKAALSHPSCAAIKHVILEFDFRRRGLRIDCILLAEGVLFVIEFKRSRLQHADRDQVMRYAINLVEFHKVTRDWCSNGRAMVVPILTLTSGVVTTPIAWQGLGGHSWSSVGRAAMESDSHSLKDAIREALSHRRSISEVSLAAWLRSPFDPSSSIIDAALSLYGNHDVAAIQDHAAPSDEITASTREIQERIDEVLAAGMYHIIFLSGAPGAGKTLVGLDIVLRGRRAGDAVFVTGNAPLVDVLNKALGKSYRRQGANAISWTPTGYRREDATIVAEAAAFKIVKAHTFLGNRDENHRQNDGRILIFDEAQRTYERGRQVLGQPLSDHEADLILRAQKATYPEGGAVIVALVGHNQAINRGERGIRAWLEAAQRLGWSYSIDDQTLALSEFSDGDDWATYEGRSSLAHGHLSQSMRYYRNSAVEEWAGAVLDGNVEAAIVASTRIDANSNTIWLTRTLSAAKNWARPLAIGGQRAGLIASGQARRLAAEGLFVDYKPDIATWMLAPNGDIRASTALETVQNQYQVQGLELEYCIVCWDVDLRREENRWAAYKLSGDHWNRDDLIDVARNGYRVLLTRARKGMIIFVPQGDSTGADSTRAPDFYDGIADFLRTCGAIDLPE